MVRHKLMKSRIRKVARSLGTFTTQQMKEEINTYPNQEGRRYNKSPNVSTNQLGSFLHMDSDIAILEKYKSGTTRTVWIWIGE